MTSRIFCMLAMWLGISATLLAQKPRWVGNTPKELNRTYRFVEVTSTGRTISAARADALQLLAQDRQLVNAVRVNVETDKWTNMEQTTVNGNMDERIRDRVDVKVSVRGQEYSLQAVKVDEYTESMRGGMLVLRTLFMVATCPNPVFDRAYLTTRYGAAPVAMSVIPGMGQIYKGSTVKGISMLAAEVVCVGGIIVCENQRSSYHAKMNEQPKFKQTYKTKTDNWETGRNICIGAAAAVWVWNIVDAAVAKGARRVKVKRSGNGLALRPMFETDAAGSLSGGATLSFAF